MNELEYLSLKQEQATESYFNEPIKFCNSAKEASNHINYDVLLLSRRRRRLR